MEPYNPKDAATGKERKRKSSLRSDANQSSKENSQSNDLSQSDFSFSISVTPPLLPEFNTKVASSNNSIVNKLSNEDSDTISENIDVDVLSNSEKDRSLHEIELLETTNDDLEQPEEEKYSMPSKSNQLVIDPVIPKEIDFNTKNIVSISQLPSSFQLNTKTENVPDDPELMAGVNYLECNSMESLNNKVQDVLNEILKSDISSKTGQQSSNLGSSHVSPRLTIEHSLVKIKDLEELLVSKDEALAALTSELDSLKQASGNLSSISNTTTTEYKVLAESYQLRLLDFQNELTHRDNIIQQLSESLEQSVVTRQQLQEHGDRLANEIINLRTQLSETTRHLETQKNEYLTNPVKSLDSNLAEENSSTVNPKCVSNLHMELENELIKVQKILSESQMPVFNDFRIALNTYISQQFTEIKASYTNELKIQIDKFDSEKMEHIAEVKRLRELLSTIKCGSTEIMELRKELEAKHAHEMEQLRMYFEKKCADLEKHYSDEVFSQQSRRISDGSSCSESEMASDLLFSGPPALPPFGPAGDNSKRYEHVSHSSAGDTHSNRKKDHSPNVFQKLESLKSEYESQKNVEVDIIRNDYENKVEDIMKNNDNVLQTLEHKYVEQIASLKDEVESLKREKSNPTNSASTSEEELAEVVLSYERRLHEQVELAKHDMITALELQIQTLLDNNGEDNQWPSEFLQLRHIFTKRYQAEIADLKEQHTLEVSKLKEEHERFIVRSAERQKRRSKDFENQQICESDNMLLITERDNLRKVNATLLQVIREIAKYVTVCEDEVNNTILGELFKEGELMDLNESNISVGFDLRDSLNNSQLAKIKRVHFAPNVSNLITFLDNDSLVNQTSNTDVSLDIRNELQGCLERLRAEASEVLLLSSQIKHNIAKSAELNEKENFDKDLNETDALISPKNVAEHEDKVSYLTRQLKTETQAKHSLNLQLHEHKNLIKTLEMERSSLENQLSDIIEKQNGLVNELDIAKQKIVELITENGQKEIVSEGYGESDLPTLVPLESPRETLTQALERARIVLEAEGDGVENVEMLTLIESLCRAGQRAQEDARRDTHDLQLQVEAADKKLRATVKFLEEQASDREAERDEAQRELENLRTQLVQKERECAAAQHIANEVEQLEHQMRDMSNLMAEAETKKVEVESELKEAVDKVWVLRDIIRELESQVEVKTEAEHLLQKQIEELRSVVKHQHRNNEELTLELDSLKSLPDNNQLIEHTDHLERELAEFRNFGTAESLQQIKTQLEELSIVVHKKTKDLEILHTTISTTNCSSPSEDISVAEKTSKIGSVKSDIPIPLLEVIRELEIALQRHTRAEGAAVKKIKDLEIQMGNIKIQFEDLQVERDALLERLAEQLTDISSLQMRLEEQRHLVQTITKQSNMSLENKVYDLENEIRELRDTLSSRDKQIKQLENVLDKSMKRLKDTEKELSNNSDNEKEIIDKLKSDVSELQTENKNLKSKLDKELANRNIVPEIMDKLLEDKNNEIDSLNSILKQKSAELELYNSLDLDKKQLRECGQHAKDLSEGKSSARTLSDIVSISEFDEPDMIMRKEIQMDSLHSMEQAYNINLNETPLLPENNSPDNRFTKVHVTDSAFLKPPDVSSIHFEELKDFGSNDISEKSHKSSSSEKRVHFCDDDLIANMKEEIVQLKFELEDKQTKLNDFIEQLHLLPTLQIEISKLQETLEDINREKLELKQQFEDMKLTEISLKTELDDVKIENKEKNKKIVVLSEDIKRRDDMFINVTKEKQDLQSMINDLEDRLVKLQDFEVLMPEKDATIEILEKKLAEVLKDAEEPQMDQLSAKQHEINDLRSIILDLETKYESTIIQFEKSENKIQDMTRILALKTENINKIQQELENKCLQCDNVQDQLFNLQLKFEEKVKHLDIVQSNTVNQDDHAAMKQQLQSSIEEIKSLKEKVADRDCEIEIINEDSNKFHEDIASLQKQLRDARALNDGVNLGKELKAKDTLLLKNQTEIDELRKEITHLQDYLKEKDKIIHQISEDSKSLKSALEAIQNKMKETGNILDLAKKYQEEQQLTAKLKQEIEVLQIDLHRLENTGPGSKGKEFQLLEDITGQVQRELDYSALLDSNILNAIENNDPISSEPIKSEGTKHQPNYSSLESAIETLQIKNNSLGEDLNKKQIHNQELIQVNEAVLQELKVLKEKFETEQENCAKLRSLLNDEKQSSNEIQIQDANIIEQMRIRLETALDSEVELEQVIEKERKLRLELNEKLKELQTRLESPLNPDNIMKETYDTELLKLCEENQRLIQENQELNKLVSVKDDDIATLKAKYSTLKYDFDNYKQNKSPMFSLNDMHKIDQVVEENVKLKIEMSDLRNCLVDLTKQLSNSKELLHIRQEELDDLHRQTEKYVDQKLNTNALQHNTAQSKQIYSNSDSLAELKQENKLLENRIKELKNELKLSRDQEIKLTEILAKEREEQLKTPVPAKFLQKLQELQNLFTNNIKENKKMAETLAKLTDERRELQAQVKDLEKQKVKAISDNETDEKYCTLFGKYLRVESFRKSLAWQKQYLLAVVYSYEAGKKSKLLPGINGRMRPSVKKITFRIAAHTILAMLRMRFLVRRWNTGVRIAGRAWSSQKPKQVPVLVSPQPTRKERGEQAETTHNIQFDLNSPIRTSNASTSWSGASPPCRDIPRWDFKNMQQMRSIPVESNLEELRAPFIIAQYVDRFDQIQQRLGLALQSPPP